MRALSDPRLLIPHLQVKVQTAKEWGATVVGYVDARDKGIIADNVLGPGVWSNELTEKPHQIGDRGWIASARVTVDGVSHEDTGTGTGDLETGAKGAASDAIKRAWVHFGLGRALYFLSKQNKVKVWQRKDGKYDVSAEEKARVREEWVTELLAMGVQWERNTLSLETPTGDDEPDPAPVATVPVESLPFDATTGEVIEQPKHDSNASLDMAVTAIQSYVAVLHRDNPADYVVFTKEQISDALGKANIKLGDYRRDPEAVCRVVADASNLAALNAYTKGEVPNHPQPKGPDMSRRKREAA
ncbi:MAG: hypothetical protein IT190_07460 [Microbacteriaceae bacterium]|nr:hypothetical protein [Microbacteriaceae bacterium]